MMLRLAVAHIATCSSGSVGYLLPPPLLSCIAGGLDTCKNGLFSWWSLLADWSSRVYHQACLSSIVSEGVVFLWKAGVVVWLTFFFVWQSPWSCYHFFLPVWTRCSHTIYDQCLLHSYVFGKLCLNGGGTLLDNSDPRQGVSLHSFFRRVEVWQNQAVHTGILHFDDYMILSCSSEHIWSCLTLPSDIYLLLTFQT